MKVSDQVIPIIAGIITGDSKKSEYKTGPMLVDFFNELGFKEVYEQGFPSRWIFAENKLKEINGTETLTKAIEKILDPRNFFNTSFDPEEIVKLLNQYLEYDGYQIKKIGKFYRVSDIDEGGVAMENTSQVNHEFVLEQLKKCEEKISNQDFDGAITNSRSLMEGLFADIHETITGSKLPRSGSLLIDYKKIKNSLNLSEDKYASESIKQILRGLVSMIDGIEKISNKMGDRHRREVIPRKHHAKLCVNATKTVADFLYGIVNYQLSGSDNLLIKLLNELNKGNKRILERKILVQDNEIKVIMNLIDDYVARLFIEKMITDFTVTSFRRSDIFFAFMKLFYENLTENDVKRILDKHMKNGQAVGLYAFIKTWSENNSNSKNCQEYLKYLQINKYMYE